MSAGYFRPGIGFCYLFIKWRKERRIKVRKKEGMKEVRREGDREDKRGREKMFFCTTLYLCIFFSYDNPGSYT
jgi:hypothetical protein